MVAGMPAKRPSTGRRKNRLDAGKVDQQLGRAGKLRVTGCAGVEGEDRLRPRR